MRRRELLRGPLYYILVLIAVTVVYWRESPAGMVAVALMCGGDGIADIVGRRFGKGNPLPHNGNKSWAGSFAMFAGMLCRHSMKVQRVRRPLTHRLHLNPCILGAHEFCRESHVVLRPQAVMAWRCPSCSRSTG